MNYKSILLYKNWVKQHLIVWLLVTIFITIVDPIESSLKIQIIGTITIMLTYILVFYLKYLLFFKFLYEKRYFIFTLAFFFTYLLFLVLMLLSFVYILSYFDINFFLNWYNLYDVGSTFFVLYCLLVLTAYGLFQNKISIYKLQQENEKEKTLITNQLLFYKNQFNSHITFNFLNYCYNFFIKNDEETAKIVANYADILRYTSDTNSTETVPILGEAKNIEKFIFVNKMVYKNLQINFKYEGEFLNKKVLPRILITLIENAIKHGDTQDEKNPINVDLTVNEDVLNFSVRNKKNSSINNLISTNTGNNNMLSHLTHFYKSNFTLQTDETKDFYNMKLIIKLT